MAERLNFRGEQRRQRQCFRGAGDEAVPASGPLLPSAISTQRRIKSSNRPGPAGQVIETDLREFVSSAHRVIQDENDYHDFC